MAPEEPLITTGGATCVVETPDRMGDTWEGTGAATGELVPPGALPFGTAVVPESATEGFRPGPTTLGSPVVTTGTIPAPDPLVVVIINGTPVDPAPELETTAGAAVEPVLIFVDIPIGTTPTPDELGFAAFVVGMLFVLSVEGPVEITTGTVPALLVTDPVTADIPLANMDVLGAAVGKVRLEADNADVKADTTLVKGLACPEIVVEGAKTDPTWDITELTIEVGFPATEPVPDPADAIEDTTEFTSDKAELTCDGLGGVEL